MMAANLAANWPHTCIFSWPLADGGMTSAERQKLTQLRRERSRRREDLDILNRAAVTFAEETR